MYLLEITFTNSYAAYYPFEQEVYPKVIHMHHSSSDLYTQQHKPQVYQYLDSMIFEQELNDFDTCNTYTGYYTFTMLK